MKEADLYTSLDQFHSTWVRADKTKRTSKTVTVDREALVNLLMDHQQMARALFPDQHTVGKDRWER